MELSSNILMHIVFTRTPYQPFRAIWEPYFSPTISYRHGCCLICNHVQQPSHCKHHSHFLQEMYILVKKYNHNILKEIILIS